MNENEPKKKNSSTLKLSLNEISDATKKSIGMRTFSAIIMAIIAVPAVILGGWYFVGLVLIVAIIAIFEIMKATKIKGNQWYIYLLAFLSIIGLTFWVFIKTNMVENVANGHPIWDVSKWIVEFGFPDIQVSDILIPTMLLGLFIILVLDKNFSFDVASYVFLLILLTGYGLQSMVFIRLFPGFIAHANGLSQPTMFTGAFLLIYVALGTIMNDIGAYFIGVLFGKNKMIPRISPNKTWEGFAGGVFFSFLFSFAFAMIVSAVGHPILPFLSHNQWYYLLLISIIMPIAATIGDLFFSASKRHLSLKDYGSLFAGHGGILDRIDSLLVVGIATSILLILINNNWDFLL